MVCINLFKYNLLKYLFYSLLVSTVYCLIPINSTTMEEDKFALVEKILKDIDNILTKNADLSSFDIVPVETNHQNKSPVMHFESYLGLESWCVKHVYMYCYSEIMDKYTWNPKRRNVKMSLLSSERLPRLLNITLLLNPELSTLWNLRRRMVVDSLLKMRSEIQFTKLVLSRKPKCNDAFAYRRWLLDRLLLEQDVINNLTPVINEELNVCDVASEKSPNNYHSWNHRLSFINKLSTIPNFDPTYVYIKEYTNSHRWTQNHVSDYSCYHYRQFCIQNLFTIDKDRWSQYHRSTHWKLRKTFASVLAMYCTNKIDEEQLASYHEDKLVNILLGESVSNCCCYVDKASICQRLEILFQELILNNELITFYKFHETLWYHRKFIIRHIIEIMYRYFGLTRQSGSLVKNACSKCNASELSYKNAKISRYDSNNVYSCMLFNVIMCHEKQFIEAQRSQDDKFAEKYEKYLRIIEGLDNVM